MTKRKEFWDVMDEIIPVGRVDRLHPTAFSVATKVVRREVVLRKCCGCICCNAGLTLSDESVEDTIYDNYTFRNMGISFGKAGTGCYLGIYYSCFAIRMLYMQIMIN